MVNDHTFPGVGTQTFLDNNLPMITDDEVSFSVAFTAAGQGGTMTQEFQAQAVPEPPALGLLAGALGSLALLPLLRHRLRHKTRVAMPA